MYYDRGSSQKLVIPLRFIPLRLLCKILFHQSLLCRRLLLLEFILWRDTHSSNGNRKMDQDTNDTTTKITFILTLTKISLVKLLQVNPDMNNTIKQRISELFSANYEE